ncbi:MAG: acyl-CoA dehydrogenase family protein [Bdellovibrionota bacterium]
MDFTLTAEHTQLRDLIRNFAEKNFVRMLKMTKPTRSQWSKSRSSAKWAWRGCIIPEEWGGAGMDPISYVIMMEEISVFAHRPP